MIQPIALKCLWIPEDIAEESELTNLPISANDIQEKEITFYVIEHVRMNAPHNCTVISGGFEYLVNETYDSVNAKILERMTFKFN